MTITIPLPVAISVIAITALVAFVIRRNRHRCVDPACRRPTKKTCRLFKLYHSFADSRIAFYTLYVFRRCAAGHTYCDQKMVAKNVFDVNCKPASETEWRSEEITRLCHDSNTLNPLLHPPQVLQRVHKPYQAPPEHLEEQLPLSMSRELVHGVPTSS